MPLYELNDNEAKFLQNMVVNVSYQGKMAELEQNINTGKGILKSLLNPINPIGKPKEKEIIE